MNASVAVASLHDHAAADEHAHGNDPDKALIERMGNARIVRLHGHCQRQIVADKAP